MEKLYGNSWALLIAIGKLNDVNFPFSPITNPVNDAKAIEEILITHCDFPAQNIISLYNEKATKKGIEDSILNIIADKANEGDRLLIFYAGHALTKPATKHKTDEEGFLIPFDAEWKKKRPKWETLKSINSLVDETYENVDANQFLFLLDCCFSGIAGKASNYDELKYKQPPADLRDAAKNLTSVQIITASSKDEAVLDSGKDPSHSIFTQTIIDFMENVNAWEYPEMFIPAKKMLKEIQSQVVGESSMKGPGHRQEPQFYRSAKHDKLGEFVLKSFKDDEMPSAQDLLPETIMDETDYFFHKVDLLSDLNQLDFLEDLNRELAKNPNKEYTASKIFTLLKEKLMKDPFISTKFETLRREKDLSESKIIQLWDRFTMNMLILGMKREISRPIVPDDEIIARNKSVKEKNEN